MSQDWPRRNSLSRWDPNWHYHNHHWEPPQMDWLNIILDLVLPNTWTACLHVLYASTTSWVSHTTNSKLRKISISAIMYCLHKTCNNALWLFIPREKTLHKISKYQEEIVGAPIRDNPPPNPTRQHHNLNLNNWGMIWIMQYQLTCRLDFRNWKRHLQQKAISS